MITVFWDRKGVLLEEFKERGMTITATFCVSLVSKWIHVSQTTVENRLKALAAAIDEEGIDKLLSRYNKCLNRSGNYVKSSWNT